MFNLGVRGIFKNQTTGFEPESSRIDDPQCYNMETFWKSGSVLRSYACLSGPHMDLLVGYGTVEQSRLA